MINLNDKIIIREEASISRSVDLTKEFTLKIRLKQIRASDHR